jgi:hypothetical protein
MYQLLFVIHGMGAGERPASDPNWWTDLVASIRGYAKPFGHDKDFVTSKPKSGQVLIVPLTYHGFFDDLRKSWRQQTPNDTGWIPLVQQLLLADPAMAGRVPGWAVTAGEFFWSHVLDVLLYRFIPVGFTTPIRDDVALQIETAWHQADVDNGVRTPVHFLAHSLGTAVLHDAICRMASFPEFGPGTHSINSIVTLANVSSVLENGNPTYDSADRTVHCAPPPPGMTQAHFSFRHELDPIAAVKAFDGVSHGWPARDHRSQVVFEVKDWNVHGYTHYLDNPAAHFPLLDRLWPDDDILLKLPAAIAAYQADPGTPCPQAIAKVRADLRTVPIPPPGAPVSDFIETVTKVVAILGSAAAACDLELPQ